MVLYSEIVTFVGDTFVGDMFVVICLLVICLFIVKMKLPLCSKMLFNDVIST
jgi:hypothetical protein